MYRPYPLMVIALFAACGDEVVWRGTQAVAADHGVPKPTGAPAKALETEGAGGLQPLNTLTEGEMVNLDNRPAFSPAMLAALEDLSKKSIAESQPAPKADQAPAKPAVTKTEQRRSDRAVAPPHVQPQGKRPPEQQAGFRARRATGPASKIEALRERIQHPSLLRRRGFRRAA